MKRFLVILFLFPVVFFSQNKNTFFAEGGGSSFIPLEKKNEQYKGKSHNSFAFNSSTSSYAKVGFERAFFSKKQLSFGINFGLGFREQNFTYKESGLVQVPYDSEFLCYTPWYVNGEKKATHQFQMTTLFFGPKLNYARGKWAFSSALNLNSDFVLKNKFTCEVLSNGESYYYNRSNSEIYLLRMLNNLSLQNTISYNLNKGLSVGIVSEISFLNVGAFRANQKNWQHLFNTNYNVPIDYYSDYGAPHLYSCLINTGLRVQYSF